MLQPAALLSLLVQTGESHSETLTLLQGTVVEVTTKGTLKLLSPQVTPNNTGKVQKYTFKTLTSVYICVILKVTSETFKRSFYIMKDTVCWHWSTEI